MGMVVGHGDGEKRRWGRKEKEEGRKDQRIEKIRKEGFPDPLMMDAVF